ncbi:MAG: hypothetical protein ACXVB9_08355 [Bdellovibrionota bacterium]
MSKVLQARRLLPILPSFAALALGVVCARNALAYDHLILSADHVQCRMVLLPGGAARADIFYDDMQIHEGREMSHDVANGDLVKCISTVDRAKRLGRDLIMQRGMEDGVDSDWGNDDFFNVDEPTPQG